jgi:hypothetical protein
MADPGFCIGAGTFLLIVLVLSASFDTFYYHIHTFKLYLYPDTRREHLVHTIQSCIVPFLVPPLFIVNASGLLLWAAVAIAAAHIGVSYWDASEEMDSRKRFGGLPKLEYCVHLFAEILKGAMLVLLFLPKPPEAWSPAAPLLLPESFPAFTRITGWIFTGVALYACGEHLILHFKYRESPAALKGVLNES